MSRSEGTRTLPLGGVVAFGFVLTMVSAASAAGSEPMLTGGLTSQPIGHYEFCKANPSECSIKLRDDGPLHLTSAVWKEIVDTNTLVNTSVKPMNDADIYGKDEVWAYPDKGAGDCEDYV